VAGLDPGAGAAARYTAITVDHFQRPRNVGRLTDADAVGRVDDVPRETTISIYVRFGADSRVERATFRTFGCSACVAASSMATELLVGRCEAMSAEELEAALGGLPEEKRYCVELVAEAVRRALSG
jgi:NifU-like protein involved in Fe-S cluster formation